MNNPNNDRTDVDRSELKSTLLNPMGRYLCLIIALLAVCGNVTLPAQPQEAPAASAVTRKPNSRWERVVMVGASVSAGFTAAEPLGGPKTEPFRLSRYIDAAILPPHQLENLASSMFFMQAEASGRRQIEAATKSNPTLVLGVDFLFWFCYGEGTTDAQRLARFEQGLKLLETVQCPLVVGDIPDASAALGRMLRPEEMPSSQAMSSANRRLKEWAAKRPQVIILELSKFMRTVAANQSLTIHGHDWPVGRTRVLLQGDNLHPSAPGCAVLTLAVLDAFQSASPDVAADDIRWDPKELFMAGYKAPKK
ncbi:MAG: hypothetical protein JWM68_4960 [Verrucomicrobiales bacterium]|nr:hypothetical protein [Verrucomicrobiales bacterium]